GLLFLQELAAPPTAPLLLAPQVVDLSARLHLGCPTHPILAPDRPDAGSRSCGSRLGCPPRGGGYVAAGASDHPVTREACPGGILLAEQQVLSACPSAAAQLLQRLRVALFVAFTIPPHALTAFRQGV